MITDDAKGALQEPLMGKTQDKAIDGHFFSKRWTPCHEEALQAASPFVFLVDF